MILNLSEEAIEKKANEIRSKVSMEYVYSLDMELVLRKLQKKSAVFSVIKSSIGGLDEDEAFMDCEGHTMLLSPKVFEDLQKCDKRAKFTAAHELGHYVLGHSGNTKRTKDKSKYLTPKQRIQEDEANRFAAFLLVPTKLATGCGSAEDIANRFQVSMTVAEIAFERVQSLLRKENGTRRRPPAVVLDFLRKAEREGYKIKSDLTGFSERSD